MIRHVLFVAAVLFGTPCLAAADPTGSRVDVNGMQMYYEVSGQGAPLIVLHGAYMNIPQMGEIIPVLARDHTVYALEMQGHGRTTNIDRPITYENLADDIAVFMDKTGLPKADIFGYSMGAGAALQLAIRHPAKVDHLALASVAFDDRGLQPAFRAFLPEMTTEMFLGSPFETAYRQFAPDPEGFPSLVDKLIALDHTPMHWEEQVKALDMPILIITGDADVVTLEHSVALLRLLGGGGMVDMGQPLPRAHLAVLPATSHTAIIHQPQLLAEVIEPFLHDSHPKGMFDQ
ncbi:MAG: alpha/beta fold hydrolase [Porphyrobacter sp.]|nr:alpha/beta fold hydrolase [Porphyrobacter sp.]